MFMDLEKYERFMRTYHKPLFERVEKGFSDYLEKLKSKGYEIGKIFRIPHLSLGYESYFLLKKDGLFGFGAHTDNNTLLTPLFDNEEFLTDYFTNLVRESYEKAKKDFETNGNRSMFLSSAGVPSVYDIISPSFSHSGKDLTS